MKAPATLAALSMDELTAVRDVRRKQLCMFAMWRASKDQEPALLAAYRALTEVEAELAQRVAD